jgi:sugar lactone lactonase YvrE
MSEPKTLLTGLVIGEAPRWHNNHVWAALDRAPGSHPDGICLDTEGTGWYADVPARRYVRMLEGEVLQTVELDRGFFACALGGSNQRTLFIAAAEFPVAVSGADARAGQVLMVEAPAPHAGWP